MTKSWINPLKTIFSLFACTLLIVGCTPQVKETAVVSNTPTSSLPEEQRAMAAYSTQRSLDFLEELTSLNAHSGWRGGGTVGEQQALDLVQSKLKELDWLSKQGMTIERDSFHVFLSTQDRISKVMLTTADGTSEIPADAVRGNRNDLITSARMDSDGVIGDNTPNPVKVEGNVQIIDSLDTLKSLKSGSLEGKIAVINYELVDGGLLENTESTQHAAEILDLKPAGILIVTKNSNKIGESHGTFLGDSGGGFARITDYPVIPMLFVKLEDLKTLGVLNWNQMDKITAASLEWDVDVINPGTSGNLIVHIPGKTGSKPFLLSAHLDSANSPGGMDDGSGTAILMEIARVLNQEHIQPDVDLYLAWFGSEELDLYGSSYFTTVHSDLVNQLQANIQIDCLSKPLEGLPAYITIEFGYTNANSVESDPLGKILVKNGQDILKEQVSTYYWPLSSDNGTLSAFGVPNLNMIYASNEMTETYAGVWYSGHFHDPYDDLEAVTQMQSVFEKMGKLALSAVFIPQSQQTFKPETSQKKALFLATYTEAPQMTPAGEAEFTQKLRNAGYEINVLPYGKEPTAEDLKDVDLLVVLPPFDYPTAQNTLGEYDVNWTDSAAKMVNEYVKNGGKALVVNNAKRLRWFNMSMEENEDWSDLNTLTDQWGIHFTAAGTLKEDAAASGTLEGKTFSMTATAANMVSFDAPVDAVKASAADGQPLIAEVQVGSGKVIVLGDLTLLRASSSDLQLLDPTLVDALVEIK